MGSDYSRIQGRAFPDNSFVLGFRQPDFLQVLHADQRTLQEIRQCVTQNWKFGIRSEKKNPLGVELRLDKEPFDSEIQSDERLLQVYRLVNGLLKCVMDLGCSLATSGSFIRGIERSAWLLRKATDLCPQRNVQLLTVAFEDWNRILVINSDKTVNAAIVEKSRSAWSRGLVSVTDSDDHLIVELDGQPFDSYKSGSELTPWLVLQLSRVLHTSGFDFVAATHARGGMDCLTFCRAECIGDERLSAMAKDEFCAVSLNQRDQIRLFAAPEPLLQLAKSTAAKLWEHGLLRTQSSEQMCVLQLKSSPWFVADWDKDAAFSAREFLQQLLQQIRLVGWRPSVKADVYRSAYDKSMLVLRRHASCDFVPHLSVTTHDVNRLCVLGASELLKSQLLVELKEAWPRSHRTESFESTSGWTVEFSFDRRPWQWDSEAPLANLEGLGLAVTLLDLLEQKGWQLDANLDISSSCKFAPSTWLLTLQEPQENRADSEPEEN